MLGGLQGLWGSRRVLGLLGGAMGGMWGAVEVTRVPRGLWGALRVPVGVTGVPGRWGGDVQGGGVSGIPMERWGSSWGWGRLDIYMGPGEAGHLHGAMRDVGVSGHPHGVGRGPRGAVWVLEGLQGSLWSW